MAEPQDQTLNLLSRWHDGDREALTQLLERDRSWIENRIRARRSPQLRQQAETVDDVQDLMLDALEYSPRFIAANRAQFRGLLARMIENRLIDRARGLERRGKAVTLHSEARLSLSPELQARQPTEAGEAAARAEELDWMRLGLEFLDAEDRALIIARQFEQKSFGEIGAAEGSTADAVRMRFHRTLLHLAGIVQALQAGKLEGMLPEEEDRD